MPDRFPGVGQGALVRIVGVILAGGQGSRMAPSGAAGSDKALLPLAGTPLLSHAMDRLGPQVAALALNANGDPARFARFGLPVLPDTVAGFAGPLAGILAGLDWAIAIGADAVVSVAVDTPFFPRDLVPRLVLAAEGDGMPVALAASTSGLHPTFGLWPVNLRPQLTQALAEGQRKVSAFAEQVGMARAEFPGRDPDPFFNLNSPADLVTAEAFMKARHESASVKARQ